MVKDPLTLWNNLRERYEHQKSFILPNACYELMHLKLHISCFECAHIVAISRA
jgi:hypothetical protein